jgi:hypothetical protein
LVHDGRPSRPSDRRQSDRDRDADTVAAGLATVRITWTRLTKTSRKEAERLKTILAGRRAALG